MNFFLEKEIFTEDFLVDWSEGKLTQLLEQHNLYDENNLNNMKEICEDFLNYIMDDEEESEEDED